MIITPEFEAKLNDLTTPNSELIRYYDLETLREVAVELEELLSCYDMLGEISNKVLSGLGHAISLTETAAQEKARRLANDARIDAIFKRIEQSLEQTA